MEVWQSLYPQFPDYSVSSYGQIRNDRTGRVLAQSMNNTGYMKVAINDANGERRTLEVTRLVALIFVPGQTEQDNTPIHLDGNREHTFADNLAWRPRWFAAQYHRQFVDGRHHIAVPIVELNTGRAFRDSLEAARAFGVLEHHIMLSTANHTAVYPDGLTFRIQ